MDHFLQNKEPWQHGIHKEWKSPTIKQGLHYSDVQEGVVDKEGAMHSKNYSTGSTGDNFKG